MTPRAEPRQAIRNWILQANGKLTATQLKDDTAILEKRIITSLQILDFILFLEELRGAPIDVTQIPKGTFRSINAIHAHFFGGGADVRA